MAKLPEELKFLKEYTQNLIENANVIIMMASPEGRLTYFNKKAEELFGYSRDEVLGRSFKILHPKEKLDQVEHYFNEIAKGKDVVDAEIPCITKQGREFIISMNSTSVRDNGKTTLMAIGYDITDRKRMETQLKESEEKYRCLIENALDGIGLYRDSILFVNNKFCELLGYTKEELHGMEVGDLVAPEDRERVKRYINDRLAGRGVPTYYETKILRKDGSIRDIEVAASRIIYKGQPAGQAILRDITERKLAEQAIKHRLEFEKIVSIISSRFIGASDIDDAINTSLGDMGKLSRASRAYLVLFREDKTTMDNTHEWCAEGVSPQIDNLKKLPSEMFPWWIAKIDKEQVIQIEDVSKMPAEAKAEKDLLESQDIKSLLVLPLTVRGKLAGFIGFDDVVKTGRWSDDDLALLRISSEIIGNALERKRAEEALRESQEKYKRIFETSKDVLYLTSREGKFIDVNQAGVDLFGYSKKELLKIDLAKHLYVNPDDRKIFQEMIEKDGFVKDYEVEWKKKDKTKIYVSITANVRKDRRGEVLGYEGIIRDVTERKKREEKIRHLLKKTKIMAERDPLTGLFNHRRINELLHNEIERAKRGADVFSIMMLDVDDLKLINDTHGHIAGDNVLKDVATILKDSSRSVDSIGRYGGDEFLMILPYTDGEKAKTMAQRISGKIQKEGLKIDGETNIPIRLSIGVAIYPFDSILPQDLISLADRSMYESKRSGRSVVSASVKEVSEFLTKERPSFDVLQSLVAAVNSKDYYTKSHSDSVNRYALSLGKKVKLSSEQMEALKIASILHDIGKIGIPETILRKPGPLKAEEFEIIKQHPRLGAMMLDGPPPHREHVLGAIMYHHERYGGKGYPGKLKGKDIPLLARIIGIVDAYSAMITDRPYRKALTKDEAIAELRKNAGTQFDPDLVSKFIECLK